MSHLEPASQFSDTMITAAIASLPERVRQAIRNVVFVVNEDEKGDLLGHYHGIPNTHRGANYFGVVPDVITLYRRTIEEEAAAPGKSLQDMVRLVVWHEVGHYLGYDEAGVRRLERKWRRFS